MRAERASLLNRLVKELPEDFVVDTSWLATAGLSPSSIRDYAARGWLEHVAPRLYRRPGRAEPGPIRWEYALLSLQELLKEPVHVGGMTALELAGYWHYAPMGRRKLWLYSDSRAVKSYLARLDLDADQALRSRKLFGDPEIGLETRALDLVTSTLSPIDAGLSSQTGHKQHLRVSSLERAILEVLDEVPSDVSFSHAAELFNGLTTLRPKLARSLLTSCRSVKAKRLFLYFAAQQNYGWTHRLKADEFDIGKGKRQIVPGGQLDRTFQITVPRRGDAEPDDRTTDDR
jgi:hypothetical protein